MVHSVLFTILMRLKPSGFRALYLCLMLWCFTGTSVTCGDSLPAANPALYRPAKSHCKVPDRDTAKNLWHAARYLRQGMLDKVIEVIKQGLPVNAVFEDQFAILGQIYIAQVGLLDMAVMYDQQDILDLLLEYGANPDGCGTRELDPAYLAITYKRFKALNKLTEAGASPDKWIGPEQNQQTALHYLVSHPDSCASEPVSREAAGAMQVLLTHGANVNALNVKGETPLIQSVQNCQHNSAYSLIPLLLITHAADPFVYPARGFNIFHKMVSHGNLSRDRDLWLLLTGYVRAGGDKMMEAARNHPYFRARIDAIQDEISSPEGVLKWFWNRMFSYGTLRDHVSEMINMFNDQRVIRHDLNKVHSLVNCHKDYDCFTPLHYAGHTLLTPLAMEWLDILGSDFSTLSFEGDSVLHYAIKNHQTDSLDALAPYFIDPMQRNNEGMTSFDVAMAFTSDEEKHTVFDSLCRMPLNSDEPEVCSAYFDLLNARCTQLMAPENITLSAYPEREQRYLSSFALKNCQDSSHQRLSTRQKLEILTESLDTTYQRINAHDTAWVKPEYLLRDDMEDYPELRNFLVQKYPKQAAHLMHKNRWLPAGNARQPESLSDQFTKLNRRADWHSPASQHLQQLQSFAQLKHYLKYDHSPEKDYIQTWLVQRNDPALFMYTLTMGMKPAVADSPCNLPEHLAYLCQSPIAAINNARSQTYNALLSLYGHYDFMILPLQNQTIDLWLYSAVHSGKTYWVEQYLRSGANPNAFISRDQYAQMKHALPQNWREVLTPMPSCGLMADALRLEKDQTEATISRLLLLYGASVDPIIPHGCSLVETDLQIPPLGWAGRIKDEKVTELLNYFDPTEVSRRARKNKPASEWYTNQQSVTNILGLTSEQYSLSLGNEIQTPLCTCLGLQKTTKENTSFAPYCQLQINGLPDEVKLSICSPDLFQ